MESMSEMIVLFSDGLIITIESVCWWQWKGATFCAGDN